MSKQIKIKIPLRAASLLILSLLLTSLVAPIIADTGHGNDDPVPSPLDGAGSTIGTVGEEIDWPAFWQTFKQYAQWDLEWFNGWWWTSVKEDLDVQLSYPELNECKINLVFDASHSGNYRLTFAINKVVRDYVTRIDQYQYVLTYDDILITFDWSDCADISGLQFSHGIKNGYFWFRIRRDNVPFGAHVEIDPATVATSTSSTATPYTYQRKSFYAEGLFWAFYPDGTNAGWEFSNDGTTWTGAFTSIGACLSGARFSIWFDGTYVHYVRYDVGTFDLLYRRGTPENDGSITWSAVVQTVYDGSLTDNYQHPSIAVDSSGYAWIGARNYDGSDYTPYVLKNDNNDGTWVLDFATKLNARSDGAWRVCPVPLTSAKVYVIYCSSSDPPLGKLYDAGWGGEETDLADYAIQTGYQFSAVADGDNVHFVYNRDVTYQIRHNERVWGVGWDVNDVLVQDNMQADNAPALSIDTVNGNLYCFWTQNTENHVYYKKYSSGSWDVAATDWIDESTDNILSDYLISSFYQDYGGYIGLLYHTKTSSPYNVRFAFLTMPVPPTTVTQTFQSCETTTYTDATTSSTLVTQWTVVQIIIDPTTTVTTTGATYTTEETTTTCETSVLTSETSTTTCDTSVDSSTSSTTICDTSISSSTTCTSSTDYSTSSTTTCDTSVDSSTSSTTTCDTSIKSSTSSTTTCDTSISSSTTCTSSTDFSTSSTTTCDTSVDSSTSSTTTCDTSVDSSTSSTTICDTTVKSSTSSTTTCDTSVYSSTSSTTFCDTSIMSSTSTSCITTTVTHVTSTSTTCETLTETECETTCETTTITSVSSTTTCDTSVESSTSSTTTCITTTGCETSCLTTTSVTTSCTTTCDTDTASLTTTITTTFTTGDITTTTVVHTVVYDGCVLDEFDDDALVAWYNNTHRHDSIVDIIHEPALDIPNGILTLVGTLDSGNLASVQTFDDGDSYNVSEAAGAPGYDIRFNFTDLTDEYTNVNCSIYVWYDGGAGHTVEVQTWNYTSGAWIVCGVITEDTGFDWFNFSRMGAGGDIVRGGILRGRIVHTSSGNPVHDIFIDYIEARLDICPCGQVWSENMLEDLNATQIVYFRYNITITPYREAFSRVRFSQDNTTWVDSDGIAQWEEMVTGDNSILLTGLDWAGNFYYRVWMHKDVNGTSPTLDLVQVCYSTIPAGGGWNILMLPLFGVVVVFLGIMLMRKRR